jgi:xylan 1,4-beta-xylosidase
MCLRYSLSCLILVPLIGFGQTPATIHVDTSSRVGPIKPIWSYFGYDEPNYTYTRNGTKLIAELASLRAPVYIRTHNLLTTGDGTPALKWGSTNAYREDEQGNPIYDWTIVDKIIDTYTKVKAKPFMEIGFMPEALSMKPQPYRHSWPKTKIAAGWAYPPKSYQKWAELIYQWVRHSIARYGEAEVNSWYWEVWNEPDIEYWQGSPEDYDRLYDFAADAVKRAAPRARVGGPASTGPANQHAAAFLTQFLQHCDSGTNAATGKPGVPLDFITFHAKGSPSLAGDHVKMGLAKELSDVASGMDIVTSFAKFGALPIILSEADPEGCAACSARTSPQNAYRNGALYPVYTAAAMTRMLDLAIEHKANLEGMLTWAFEFEDQPYFDGFRTLATNGIDKPVLNFFRMASKMTGDRVAVKTDSTTISALASRSSRSAAVLLWNYRDDDVPGPDTPVRLNIAGLPSTVTSVGLTLYRIDKDHSNSYTAWKRMGSPQKPTPEQYAQLEAGAQLQRLDGTRTVQANAGAVDLTFSLPEQSLSLIELEW